MKKVALLLIFASFSIHLISQNIKAELGVQGKFIVLDGNGDSSIVSDHESHKIKLGEDGSFVILNDGTFGIDEIKRLIIKESGEVNWELGNNLFFIRDTDRELFPVDSAGNLYNYNFIVIDGQKGRLGINAINGRTSPSLSNSPKDKLTSSVNLFGSVTNSIRLLDGSNNYLINHNDHTLIVDNSANNQVTDIILPQVDSTRGREYRIKRNDDGTGKIFVKPQQGEKLNGEIDRVIELNNQNASLEIVSDGNSWWLISQIKTVLFTRQISTNYSILLNDDVILADATLGTVNLNLPSASIVGEGKQITVKRVNTGANFVEVNPFGSETIDGLTQLRLTQAYDYITVVSDGINWLLSSERITPLFINNPSLPYDISPYDETISVNSTGTLNLPSVSDVLIGKKINIKNTGSNGSIVLTIAPFGLETIESGTPGSSILLANSDAVTLQSNGLGWVIISYYSLP